MLEVEGSISFGQETYVFYLPIYIGTLLTGFIANVLGPYDVRVWMQKPEASFGHGGKEVPVHLQLPVLLFFRKYGTFLIP